MEVAVPGRDDPGAEVLRDPAASVPVFAVVVLKLAVNAQQASEAVSMFWISMAKRPARPLMSTRVGVWVAMFTTVTGMDETATACSGFAT